MIKISYKNIRAFLRYRAFHVEVFYFGSPYRHTIAKYFNKSNQVDN